MGEFGKTGTFKLSAHGAPLIKKSPSTLIKESDFYGASAKPSPNPGPINSGNIPLRGATTALSNAPFVNFPGGTQWYDACTMFIFDFGYTGQQFPDPPNGNWMKVSDQSHGGLWGSGTMGAFGLRGGYQADRDGSGVQLPAKKNRFVALYSWNTSGIAPSNYQAIRSWSASASNLKTGWTNGNTSNIQMYAVSTPGSVRVARVYSLQGHHNGGRESDGLAYTCNSLHGATVGLDVSGTSTAGWMEMKIT